MSKDEYIKNIQIVDIDLTNTFWGDRITIKIIDDNKKYFKKKTLHREYFEIKNVKVALEETIESYIWTNYGHIYRQEELNEMLNKWKEKQ